jgi:hypothetical protein
LCVVYRYRSLRIRIRDAKNSRYEVQIRNMGTEKVLKKYLLINENTAFATCRPCIRFVDPDVDPDLKTHLKK